MVSNLYSVHQYARSRIRLLQLYIYIYYYVKLCPSCQSKKYVLWSTWPILTHLDPSCIALSSFRAASLQLRRQIVSEISTNISCRCGALLAPWWPTAVWAMVHRSMRLCCCRRLGTSGHMGTVTPCYSLSALSYLQEVKEKGPWKDEGVKMSEVSSEFRKIEMRMKGIPALSFLYSYFTKELWTDKNLH